MLLNLHVKNLALIREADIDLENGFIDVNHTLGYFDHRDEKKCYYLILSTKLSIFIL